ncbi:PcfJ domain-containing protein [Danxiaibacter flavus]|uniref:PcfJ domain-containing protein n=1 Tax=Danxiaibacter flavus TaxID=3049108 RepID=A0ABV3ZQL2_9BACT|nr:PcfJ domain-containing protein [Chitinophagaceae bacterium DXS]
MKARTKLQIRVKRLSEKLPRITKSQEEWAYSECLPHLAYANKSSAFCLDCGKMFSLELVNRSKRATCPHCNTKLKVEYTRKTTHKKVNYFAITHIVEEFQVAEYFELYAYYKKGKPVKYFLHAILEDWILPNGKITKIGLLHNCTGYCDSWTGDWEIREDRIKYYYNSRKYDVYARKYHPASAFKPEYLKIGINKHLAGMTLIEAITIIPTEPKAETLLKAKRFDLLETMVSSSGAISRNWPSIRIVLRNKYKINDVSIWFDYLDLLRYFNKDLHNAKYVCPKDLKKEHDRLVAKKRERERMEEIERKRKHIAEAELLFKSKIEKFVGIQFKSGNILVKVLESVKEFEEEGDILKHCLFTNEYYAKEDSLILSARIDNVPIETIEVNLSSMKIEQSRGLQNQPTEYNQKIISLVNRNLAKIRKIARQKIA